MAEKREEFSAECCQPVVQHPTSIMLWGCISFQGVGSLHRIRGRLNSEDYQAILGDVMLPDARRLVGEDFIFQQDNATIHTSRSTRQWLRDNEVTVFDWSAKSPDANPIENLSHVLKVRAYENILKPNRSCGKQCRWLGAKYTRD